MALPGRRSSIMSYDYSVWPYCSPDFDNSQFVLSIANPTQTTVDFPCNMNIEYAMALPLIMSLVALVFCTALYFMLDRYPVGPETPEECNKSATLTTAVQIKIGKEMNNIAKQVQDGAKAFLAEEYFWLAIFVAFMFCVLLVLFTLDDNRTDRSDGISMASCFFAGAVLSATAGYVGMVVATDANVRTTQAARSEVDGGNEGGGLNSSLRVAFTGGAVMGFVVVGLGLFGVSLFMLIMSQGRDCADYKIYFGDNEPPSCEAPSYEDALDSLAGFGFGASSIALFARVAGGIYTKAADVGADLVGKAENSIPEDSAENPATIADNVGDNVGDVAGMGADLFESYAGSIIAACTLAGTEFVGTQNVTAAIALPFWISGFGILCSIIGTFAIKTKDQDATDESKAMEILDSLLKTIRNGIWFAGFLVTIMAIVTCYLLFGLTDTIHLVGNESTQGWKLFMCIVIGLVVGNVIGSFTEYCTSYTETPTQSIAKAAEYGPATVVIQGLGVGMISVVVPSLSICIAIIGCDECAGVYGVAISAVGMLSTLGITLATDAYGPVADNAGGIAEMDPGCSEQVRDTTDALDALGNTTAATGKGFAIGSAVLTASALMSAFMNAVDVKVVDLKSPVTVVGALIGAMLPFIFAALTMLSVGTAAMAIIVEVRRQFKEKPHLISEEVFEGDMACDSTQCIKIATNSSLEEM